MGGVNLEENIKVLLKALLLTGCSCVQGSNPHNSWHQVGSDSPPPTHKSTFSAEIKTKAFILDESSTTVRTLWADLDKILRAKKIQV